MHFETPAEAKRDGEQETMGKANEKADAFQCFTRAATSSDEEGPASETDGGGKDSDDCAE